MYIRYQDAQGTFVMLKLSFLTMAYDAMLPGNFVAPFQVRIATRHGSGRTTSADWSSKRYSWWLLDAGLASKATNLALYMYTFAGNGYKTKQGGWCTSCMRAIFVAVWVDHQT